jgi:hypothetical protein
MSRTNTKTGTFAVGSNLSRRPSYVSIQFPQPFDSIPIVHLTPLNDGNNDDTFAVTIAQTTKKGFSAFVRRVSTNQEIPTWGQNLKLNWFATERDDVFNGQIRVGTNLNHFDCVRTLLPMRFSTATGEVHVVVTPHSHSGTDAEETFSSTVKEIRTKSRAVEIVTRRVAEEISKGWTQELILNYSFVTKIQDHISYSSTVNIGSNKQKEKLQRTVSIPSKVANTFGNRVPTIIVATRSDPLSPKDDTFAVSLGKIGTNSFDVIIRRTCHDMTSTWDQNIVIDCVVLASDSGRKPVPDISEVEVQLQKSLNIKDSFYEQTSHFPVMRPQQQQSYGSSYSQQPVYQDDQYSTSGYRSSPGTAYEPQYGTQVYSQQQYRAPPQTGYQQGYQKPIPPPQPVQSYQQPVTQQYSQNYTAPQRQYPTQTSGYQQPVVQQQRAPPQPKPVIGMTYQQGYKQSSAPVQQNYHNDHASAYQAPTYTSQQTYTDTHTTTHDQYYDGYDNSSGYDNSATVGGYPQQTPQPRQPYYGTSRGNVQTSVIASRPVPVTQPVKPVVQGSYSQQSYAQPVVQQQPAPSYQTYPQQQQGRVVTGPELVQKLKVMESSEKKMNLLMLYMSNPRYAHFKDYEVGDVIAEFHTNADKELALNTIVTGDKLPEVDVLQVEDVLSQFDSQHKLNALGELAPKIRDLVNAGRLLNLFDNEYDRNQARYLLGMIH